MDKFDRLGRRGRSNFARAGPQGREWRFHERRGIESGSSRIAFFCIYLDGGDPMSQYEHTANVLILNASHRVASRVASANRTIEWVLKNSNHIARFMFGSAGYADGRIMIDPSVVRGLEYYTGPVFEVDLTFPITAKTASRALRLRGGGGRYDGLVSRFRGEPVPATGFSIGVSRLAAALQHLGKLDEQARARPGRRHRVRQGPPRRLPEHGREAARGQHPRRALSRQSRAISAISSNTPTSATRPASSSRAPTRRPRAKSPSRT